MGQIDFSSPLIYLISSVLLLILFSIVMVLNKLLEDKLVNWVKNFYKKIKTHDDINNLKMQEIITNINSDLAVLRNECYSDRACIFEFHNGSEFTSKFPSWKVTNTYERVRPGIPYGKEKFNQIPATLIWDNFLEFIFKEVSINENDGHLKLPNGIEKHSNNLRCKSEGCVYPRKVLKFIPSEIPFSNIRTFLEQQGIQVVFYTPIIDINGKIIGIVSVEYNDFDDFKENEAKITPCLLCNFAANISLIWQLENETLKRK